jgi:hypothetical protein
MFTVFQVYYMSEHYVHMFRGLVTLGRVSLGCSNALTRLSVRDCCSLLVLVANLVLTLFRLSLSGGIERKQTMVMVY